MSSVERETALLSLIENSVSKSEEWEDRGWKGLSWRLFVHKETGRMLKVRVEETVHRAQIDEQGNNRGLWTSPST